MGKKTEEQFILEMIEKAPNITVVGNYRNTHTKIDVKCKVCGYSWKAEPNSMLRGTGCPACSGRVPISGKNDFATLHPELLKEWNYKENTIRGIEPNDILPHSSKRITWTCSKCGFNWIATPDKRVGGQGCPMCSKDSTTEGRIKTIIKKRGSLFDNYHELIDEWDYEKNEKCGLNPKQLTISSNQVANWKCKSCGYKWEAIIANRTKGSGCPACTNKKIIPGQNDLCTTHPHLVEEWHPTLNKISPKEVSQGSEYRAKWCCKKCNHVWEATIYSRVAGCTCPNCAKKWQTSVPEQTIYYYIKKVYPNTINGYAPEWLKPSEIDVFIPEINVGIEYDGQAWHSNVDKDINKNLLCEKHGIKILRIREPQCPTLEQGHWVYILKNKSLRYIDVNICEILKILSNHINQNIEVDVNFERDKEAILQNYGYMALNNSIADIPGVKERWNYDVNGTLRPEMFSPSSNIVVSWRCPICGISTEAAIAKRSKKPSACPICSSKKILPGINDFASIHPELMNEWDFEINTQNGIFPDKLSKGSSKKVAWICKKCGHKWEAKVSNRVYEKSGCPKCYVDRKQKKIIQVAQYSLDGKLIEIHRSASEAAKKNNIVSKCIAAVCRGERKTYKGFVWKYYYITEEIN